MSVALIVNLTMVSLPVKANTVSVDYIRGEGDVEGIKLAYQFYQLSLDEYVEDLRIYLETSINFWEYGTPRQHDTNFILAVSPVLQKTFCYCGTGRLFGEFGIGLSLLDDTRFAGKDVSTHYQFEDRLGIGYQFGGEEQYRLALRYFHYSNGGIKKPNPGLDFVSFSFAMRW
ncbi:MAG: acyloxyacyl hydrolase [Alteromonadaceae bacterium]|nr:acyloxyacyl hydrolase [Alteromonadaceae bacterium]